MIDLRHGDCLDILPEMPDASIDMVLTDLPYGTTRNKWDSMVPLEPLWEQFRRVTKEDAAIVLFSQQPFTTVLGASNIGELRYEWVWEKTQPSGFLNANRAPMKIHENILVFYRRPPKYNPQKAPTGKTVHRNAGPSGTTTYGEFTRQLPVDALEDNPLNRFSSSDQASGVIGRPHLGQNRNRSFSGNLQLPRAQEIFA